MPERLTGLGKAYRATFTLHYSEPAEWARTPEFQYVFNKILTIGRDTAGPVSRQQILFLSNGRWLSEREAMIGLSLDAATLRQPQMREQIERQRARMESESVERKAARVSLITPAAVSARLAEERYRKQLTPCLQLPVHEADLTTGFSEEGRAA